MNKVGLYLLSSASALLVCSLSGLAADNTDAPMPIFPREAGVAPAEKLVPKVQSPAATVDSTSNSTSNGLSAPKSADVPVPQTLVLTTSYFSTERNPKHAFQEACEQQGAHFNEPSFYYRKACILIQMKSYSRAEQELKNLIADIPNNSDYHLARAYCYYKMNNKTAALDEINTARFHNPRLPQDIQIGNE